MAYNVENEKNKDILETTQEESQYARSLIEASLDPLVTISVKGKIMDMNEALANITGMTRPDLVTHIR